ncbi:hypothetical protein O988_02725 [Pseudogymnoascus sp. VKM F-3808]|nr:hypothetical protein O988_02725 [Pseudogymnoascus sp. VKM F-3808]
MERMLLPKMTILAWLLSLFKALFPPQQVSLNSTPFETLPFELVIFIAKYLSPSDAASFALSCRRIRAVLGNQHLDSLRPEASDEPSRLQMPLNIACDSCLMHHRYLSERHRAVLYARREEPLDEVDDDELVAMCLSLSESFVDSTFRRGVGSDALARPGGGPFTVGSKLGQASAQDRSGHRDAYYLPSGVYQASFSTVASQRGVANSEMLGFTVWVQSIDMGREREADTSL